MKVLVTRTKLKKYMHWKKILKNLFVEYNIYFTEVNAVK